MLGWMGHFGRALALGLGVAVLAGCASTPAPIARAGAASTGWGAPGPQAERPFSPDAPPRILDPNAHLQCVPFARSASGIQIYGDANLWWARAAGRYPRSSRPAAGAVLAIRGYNTNTRGHVAVVTEVLSPRLIRVDHANWLNGGEVSVGVPVADVSPNNDWSQIRVWHIPGEHWGGRVYRADGFIHPVMLMAGGAGSLRSIASSSE
ncbi:MAG: CHAP domain-containing protein [Hyphomonadaceae bacterium]|nr:CHAP domain-containing protein [Hyphomonadaceae bacterium]MBX3511913.1 CHAP domain-containing protein [Hyphomonadaceae bacterium]